MDEADGLAVEHPLILQALYQRRSLRPLWVSFPDGAPQLSEAGRVLVDVLRHTPREHGLEGERLEVSGHRAGLDLELALSDALVRYADAMGVAAGTEGDARRAAMVEVLGPFFDPTSDITQLERAVEPWHPQYRALMRVYAQFRDAPELEPLPADLLRFDGEGLQRHMVIVGQRLDALGYRADTGGDWGARFVASLRAFQRAHNLQDTGVVDRETLDALNMPMSERRQRVEAALAAWRDVRPARDPHYVLVNIPDMHGEVWADGERELRFKVIVGAGERVYDPALGKRVFQGETPRFSDVIEIIEFNPYWWIPDGIVARELAPIQARDPSFYERRGYEWGRTEQGAVHLRQVPGPDNALGHVKFLFPNEHDVYLHDTNQRELFDEQKRNLSHGCVRVEHPMELARHLLVRDGQVSGARVDDVVADILTEDEPHPIELRQAVPIHLAYIPVRVDEQGYAHFLPDIYGLLSEE